jgi:antitoxin (DNA-binding transcriptional repressor) of toxin-antitoxin stability system
MATHTPKTHVFITTHEKIVNKIIPKKSKKRIKANKCKEEEKNIRRKERNEETQRKTLKVKTLLI